MSPKCHQNVTKCHQNVTKMSRDVTRCHQVSPGVTKCHGMSRSITKCLRGVTVSQNVSELSPNVTKVSPKCHGMSRNVTKCHNLSPKCHRYVAVCHHLSRSCHRLSLQITEHHVHCLCDIDLLGWGVCVQCCGGARPCPVCRCACRGSSTTTSS